MVDLCIHVADAVIGSRLASKKKEEMWTKNTVCFTAVELEKKRYIVRDFSKSTRTYRVLLIDGGAVKKILRHSTRKNKSNDLEPHFRTSATKSRCLLVEDTKTAVALPHCSESTKESIAGWSTFGLEVRLKLLAELRNVVH